MTRQNSKLNIFNLEGLEYQLSLVLLFGIAVLGIGYVYLVLNSLHLVVERKNIEESKTLVSVAISDLAVKYINRQEEITKDRANEFGFVDSNAKSLYATRQQDSLTLTLLSDNDLEQ